MWRQAIPELIARMGSPQSGPGPTRFGCVGILGRANAGKSSLMNALVGEKVAIVAPRPQTTRRRVLGVLTVGPAQLVFCDTPGLHEIKHALDEYMQQEIAEALAGMSVVLYLVDSADADPAADRTAIAALGTELSGPVMLVFNKIDLLGRTDASRSGGGDGGMTDRSPASHGVTATRDTVGHDDAGGASLARLADEYRSMLPVRSVHEVSAVTGAGLMDLLAELLQVVPEGPHAYDEDTYTLESEREIAAEAVREQVLLRYRHEIPHGVAVEIEEFKERDNGKTLIRAVIQVERESQKKILLGTAGAAIKGLGTAARLELNRRLGRDIFLELWVKVAPNWRRHPHLVRRFGYRRR